MNKFNVTGPNGETLTVLNSRLAKRQGLSDAAIEALKTSHQLLWMIFEAARNIAKDKDRSTADIKLSLKMLANTAQALELEQQKLWNFKPDVHFCRFFDFPECSCPKLDNGARLGTSFKIVSVDCIIHGNEE